MIFVEITLGKNFWNLKTDLGRALGFFWSRYLAKPLDFGVKTKIFRFVKKISVFFFGRLSNKSWNITLNEKRCPFYWRSTLEEGFFLKNCHVFFDFCTSQVGNHAFQSLKAQANIGFVTTLSNFAANYRIHYTRNVKNLSVRHALCV